MPQEKYTIIDEYSIIDDGRVFSWKQNRPRELKQTIEKGYCRVSLSKKNKTKICFVHRLVAIAFIPNPENKQQVNHKDGNKENNCVSNLEWATREENNEHKKKILGYTGEGKQNSNYKRRKGLLYPNAHLRNELVKAGLPRQHHNLAELGERLPTTIKVSGRTHRININNDVGKHHEGNQWLYYFDVSLDGGKTTPLRAIAKTEADARAKMWLYLKKEKLI